MTLCTPIFESICSSCVNYGLFPTRHEQLTQLYFEVALLEAIVPMFKRWLLFADTGLLVLSFMTAALVDPVAHPAPFLVIENPANAKRCHRT